MFTIYLAVPQNGLKMQSSKVGAPFTLTRMVAHNSRAFATPIPAMSTINKSSSFLFLAAAAAVGGIAYYNQGMWTL
jgi:hypothetical protein